MREYQHKLHMICCLILFMVSVVITGRCLKLLGSELMIREAISKGIDYDRFRNVKINEAGLDDIRRCTKKVIETVPEFSALPFIDEYGYLTFAMMLSDYDLLNRTVPDEEIFIRGIGRASRSKAFQELYSYYRALFSDIEYFPVPIMGKGAEGVAYDDSWYAPRSYGGNRSHEGTDLMAGNNTRGYFPVISITDGVVEKLGWLEQGGYRVGIRAGSGAYFYYAHLDSYAPGLKAGDRVIAGQLLGFMGDTGYGPEGTMGMFDVHLHLGIYVPSGSVEISVNPYWMLKILENKRTSLCD